MSLPFSLFYLYLAVTSLIPDVFAARTKFVILHFNDFHARLEPDSEYHGHCYDHDAQTGRCHGGIARMKALIDQERAKGLPLMVLNAGDDFIGTEWDNRYQGKATAHFMNKLGITAMTLGNHEFDFGPDVLLQHVKSLNYPVLSSNFESGGHELGNYVRRHTITYVKNADEDGVDVKVGICGPTTLYTNQGSRPWPSWMSDDNTAAQSCVNGLKQEGAKIIILLTHVGFGLDKVLAGRLDDVDIVIGGHSHAFLYDGTPPALSHGHGQSHRDHIWGNYPTWINSQNVPGKRVPVLQAKAFSRYLGKVEVEFDADGNLINLYGKPILLGDFSGDHQVTQDHGVKEEIKQWKHW